MQIWWKRFQASFPGTRKIGGSAWYTLFAHVRSPACYPLHHRL